MRDFWVVTERREVPGCMTAPGYRREGRGASSGPSELLKPYRGGSIGVPARNDVGVRRSRQGRR